jgi:hypothetical protein
MWRWAARGREVAAAGGRWGRWTARGGWEVSLSSAVEVDARSGHFSCSARMDLSPPLCCTYVVTYSLARRLVSHDQSRSAITVDSEQHSH